MRRRGNESCLIEASRSSDLWLENTQWICLGITKLGMKKIKRALSLKGKGTDETLSELAEQMSFDVNGRDTNGENAITNATSRPSSKYF